MSLQQSKLVANILRHNPSEVGVTLDEEAFVCVGDLLDGIATKYPDLAMTRNDLTSIVLCTGKRRFEFNEDRSMVRAMQGHSVPTTITFKPVIDVPSILYHGTGAQNLASIQSKGLLRMTRHHVHLSPDEQTARIVGSRRRAAVIILKVRAAEMAAAGHKFYISNNGVYLTDQVPVEYIAIDDSWWRDARLGWNAELALMLGGDTDIQFGTGDETHT